MTPRRRRALMQPNADHAELELLLRLIDDAYERRTFMASPESI